MTNDIIKICEKTLERLKNMGSEFKGGGNNERMIFPSTNIYSKSNESIRISEQELRQIFIEEFKKLDNKLYYSIETPTVHKYSFGKTFADIKIHNKGRSGSMDMTIFEKDTSNYKRIYNIEFKHANCELKSIAKDIFKLIHEKEDGAFIILLDNTDKGTLQNKKGNSKSNYGEKDKTEEKGVIDKLYDSFKAFRIILENQNKNILLVILSLEQCNRTTKSAKILWYEVNNTKRRGLKRHRHYKHRNQLIENMKIFKWKSCEIH